MTLLRAPGADIAEANLLLACEADPALDLPGTLAQVDELALEAGRLGGTADAVIAVLRSAGFAGDRERYDDPANSFLHEVLRRRRGLPILLSALTIAVGDRTDTPFAGIGLPGHFVVADRSGPAARYLDPFNGWVELGRPDLEAVVRSAGGPALRDEDLAPVDARTMVRRMLANLRGSYLSRRTLADALWTVELESMIAPDDGRVRLQRRALLIGLGRYDEAQESVEAELRGNPAPDLRTDTEAQLTAIVALRRRMN